MSWERFINKVTCGDCLELMKEIPDGAVDLVVTDPPYGVKKAEWDDVFPKLDIWQELNRIMCDGASLLVFPGEKFIPQKLSILFEVFEYQWVIVWYKNNAMQFGKTGYAKQNLIWWLSKGDPIARPKINDVIAVPMILDHSIHHPTPKPRNIIDPLVCHWSKGNDLILDLFAGSGTTLVAAKQLGRRFIGFEIEPKYVDITEERLKQEVLGL